MARYRMKDVGVKTLIGEVKVWMMLSQDQWVELRLIASRNKTTLRQTLKRAVANYIEEQRDKRTAGEVHRLVAPKGARFFSKTQRVQVLKGETGIRASMIKSIHPELAEASIRETSLLRPKGKEPKLTPAPQAISNIVIPHEGWEESVRKRLAEELPGQQTLFGAGER